MAAISRSTTTTDGRRRSGFAFTFFGRRHDRVFVNSDGNVTFDERDVASSERSVTRLLTGAPRIAPLFADLNPAAGGRVLISGSVAAYTVTWCAVPEYGTQRAATTQLTVLPTGVIEIQSSGRTTVADAIVGISPGRDAAFAPIDLSAAGVAGEAGQAIGERFTTRSELDTVSTLKRCFGVFPDEFDNVVMFTDSSVLTNGAFAYELTVANDIQGLNIDLFDASQEWGSRGALQSLVMMDALCRAYSTNCQMHAESAMAAGRPLECVDDDVSYHEGIRNDAASRPPRLGPSRAGGGD